STESTPRPNRAVRWSSPDPGRKPAQDKVLSGLCFRPSGLYRDKMRRAWNTLALMLLAGRLSAQTAPPTPGEDLAARFAKEIRPLLESHCFKCHGPQKKKGGIDYSRLADGAAALRERRVWKKAALQVEENEMPPEGEKPLAPEQRETLLRWIRGAASFVDCSNAAERNPGPPVLRRLNRAEYSATVRDLAGVTAD